MRGFRTRFVFVSTIAALLALAGVASAAPGPGKQVPSAASSGVAGAVVTAAIVAVWAEFVPRSHGDDRDE